MPKSGNFSPAFLGSLTPAATSYTITGKFYYDSLTVSYTKQSDVSYADNTKSAYWSKFANDAITLGDGEKMTFKFSVISSVERHQI